MKNLVFGIRPVLEAISSGKQVDKLYIKKGAEGQLLGELKEIDRRARTVMQEVPVEKPDRPVKGGANHQGVVAQMACNGDVHAFLWCVSRLLNMNDMFN